MTGDGSIISLRKGMLTVRLSPVALAALLLCCCSEDDGPPLPKIDSPYVVSKEVRAELAKDADRKFAWNTAVKTCKGGMKGQRAIGVFDDYDVTDTEIDSYCDCITDEAYRGKTTKQIADMDINRESGSCRRYYRPVKKSDIK